MSLPDDFAPSDEKETFPHATGVLRPQRSFCIGKRRLLLYRHTNRIPTAAYSLYWSDERNPVQHGMTAEEVFTQLSLLLEAAHENNQEPTP